MTKGVRVLIALVLVAVIAGGAILVLNNKKDTEQRQSTADTSTPTEETPRDESVAPMAVTVTYTADGFSPESITIGAGGTITFVNQTDEEVEPSSGPHPDHTDNPELNAGEIEPGESATITVTNKGTWGVHNHHNEDKHLTVTVK